MSTNQFNKWVVISNSFHPLQHKVKDLPNYLDFNEAMGSLDQLADLNIVDLTLLPTGQKEYWLDELDHHKVNRVLCDLSCYWVDKFLRNYPLISSSFATCFHSPTKKFEAFAEIPGDDQLLATLGTILDLEPVFVSKPSIGYTYGQVVSMIINEGFFALEDELASPQDIDAAMKSGVNYPIGPFELLEHSSSMAVVNLLDELFSATGNPRYRVSPKLRLHQ